MKKTLLPALAAACIFCCALNAQDGFFSGWLQRSDQAKADQPHWMTPLATVTPRLEQGFRTDFLVEQMPTGDDLVNFGNTKGLELIPYERVELLFAKRCSLPFYPRSGQTYEKRTTSHDLSQATLGPMHQPRRDGFSGKVVHRETL